MATFAQISPPLRRLFDRLDAAIRPRDPHLSDFLDAWSAVRANRLYPAPADMPGAEPLARGFLYRRAGGTDEYRLDAGPQALASLMGPVAVGDRLSAAANRRAAVRLRRLFGAVGDLGEPILAEFALEAQGEAVAVAEVLVAPLSDDGRTVDALIGTAKVRRSAHPHPGHRRAPALPVSGPVLFALAGPEGIGGRIARALGADLAPHEERRFEDGEHKARPLAPVRGRDVAVIDSLAAGDGLSPNDRLCRLLFFIGALKQAAAARVSAVVPYLAYARKDRQTKPHDPVTSRYVAQLFEAIGTDRLVTMEVHNPAAFQNAFRCDTDHLEATGPLAAHFAARFGEAPVAVVSPDLGGAKRAERFREVLQERLGRPVERAFHEKSRSMGVVSGDLFAGKVAGHNVVIVDDIVATGTTMARTAAACRARGAGRIAVVATHGLFTGGGEAVLRSEAIDELVVTDTVEPPPLDPALVRGRLTVVPVAAVFADCLAVDFS